MYLHYIKHAKTSQHVISEKNTQKQHTRRITQTDTLKIVQEAERACDIGKIACMCKSPRVAVSMAGLLHKCTPSSQLLP